MYLEDMPLKFATLFIVAAVYFSAPSPSVAQTPTKADEVQLLPRHWTAEDPMEGLSLAGPRFQCAFGFILALEMAAFSATSFVDDDSGAGAGFAAGAVFGLGMGIWGAVRLRARRVERLHHWSTLPDDLAMQQRDVRLVGPRAMVGIGSVFLISSLAIPPYVWALVEDPGALLIGLPYLAIGSLLFGLGIRRLRERHGMRARFIGNGVSW